MSRRLQVCLGVCSLSLAVLVLLASVALTQQGLPTPQEQLAQCQAVIRVKQDMQVSAEQLAAVLLKRAEKAEAELAQLKAQAAAPQSVPAPQ